MKSKNGTAKSRVLALTGVASLLWLTVPVSAAQVQGPQETTERKLETLSIEGETFDNVRVFNLTPTDVMFRHDRGLTGLKVQYLDNATLRRLGYEIEAPPVKPTDLASERLETLPILVPPGDFRWGLLMLSAGILTLLVGTCVYAGYVFRLICLKSGTTPGFTIWLPFLQAFPLLRAARMSWAWLVAVTSLSVLLVYAALRVPEHTLTFAAIMAIAFVGLAIVWSIRICHACGKNSLFAMFLLFPGLNCLAFVYLAGSK